MAVISDYEEEPMQSHTATPHQPKPPEPAKSPASESVVYPDSELTALNPPEGQPLPPPPSPSPPHSDQSVYEHDPVLYALLEKHKRLPLELLTTVIDFLFRATDLSNDSRVEFRVTEIVTAAKRRRSTYDGEDIAPEKVAKVEKTECLKKDSKSPRTKTETPCQTSRGDEKSESSDLTQPLPRKDSGIEQAVVDAEGTGLPSEQSALETEKRTQEPNIGNGFDHEKYSWTQTLGELTLHIPMAEGTKAKAVECEIKRSTVKAGIKGQHPILEGEFYQAVKVDDCFWSLDEDGTLSVYLTKFNRMEWWRSVVKGEPEINSRKVEPEKSRLDDLDSETRQTAEKMMYDQRQKALGLPTSGDVSKNDAIKKFMEQHPEMDFSKANIC